MKLTDAAIWDIEMGARAQPPAGPPSPERFGYAAFEPAFTALPWLHKAQLRVVDVQAPPAGGSPSWLVVADTEEAGVFLLLFRSPAGAVGVYAVNQVLASGVPAPGSSTEPSGWSKIAPITGPMELLRALNNPWGIGRHVGD